MWIERLRIRGFGMLPQQEYTFRRDRVNLLIDRNEQGKSTLLQALLAAVYGLHQVKSGRRYALEEEGRYKPWNGKSYGLEAVFRLNGEGLEVRRNLAKKEVKVLRDGRDVTEEFRRGKALIAVGQEVTGGLSRDLFLKTFCVTHAGLQAGGFAGLAEPVEQALSTQTGGASAEDALGVLREALDTLGERIVPVPRAKKADRTVAVLEETLRKLEGEKEALLLEKRRLESQREDRLSGQEDPDRLAEETERLQFLHDLAALAEAEREIEEIERLEKAVEETRLRVETLKPVLEKDLDSARLAALHDLAAGARAAAREVARLKPLLEEAETRAARLQKQMRKQFPGDPITPSQAARLRDAFAQARHEEEQQRRAGEDVARFARKLREEGIAVEEAEARDRTFARIADQHGLLAELGPEVAPPQHLEEKRRRLRSELRAAAFRRSPLLWWSLPPLPLGAGLLLLFRTGSPVWTGLASALLVGGIFGALVAAVLSRQRTARIRADLEREERRAEEADRAGAERRARIEMIAKRAGLEPDRLETEWRLYLAHHHHLEELRDARRRVEEAEGGIRQLLDACKGLLAPLLGKVPRDGGIDLLEKGVARAGLWEELTGSLEEARREGRTRREEIQKETEREAAAIREAARILEAAGLKARGPLDEGVSLYRDTLAGMEEAVRLRDQVLPEREGRLRALRQAEPMGRRDALRGTLRRAVEAHPDWESLQPKDQASAYDARRREALARLQASQEAMRRFGREVAAEEARLQKRFAALDEELEATRRDLARATEFRDCVRLALEELGKIAKESYRLWSRQLNPRVHRLAGALMPNLKRFEFTPELDYRMETKDGQRLEEADIASLSRGARAQLLLAIRLGLAAYLGAAAPTGTVPLMLDDPFVHFDDDRHLQAVKILLEQVLPGHQVFLFSCHEVRYRHLLELLGAELEDRIHAVEPTG